MKVKFATISGTLRTPGSTATVTAFVADGLLSTSTVVANLSNPSTSTETGTLTAPARTPGHGTS